ncbi:uncharacterized protein METZ01_LOCUS360449 [marine metagenome]|uniref:Uncharacterized protein n=1 Tax=marine metagenome TaxID=408172 RepID=A0A382SDS3_9ZZZZ
MIVVAESESPLGSVTVNSNWSIVSELTFGAVNVAVAVPALFRVMFGPLVCTHS